MPTVPPELVQACAGGDCIVFLGSGVGAQVGLPTWTELLNLIISRTAPDRDLWVPKTYAARRYS
jgi:hypothetical protein